MEADIYKYNLISRKEKIMSRQWTYIYRRKRYARSRKLIIYEKSLPGRLSYKWNFYILESEIRIAHKTRKIEY